MKNFQEIPYKDRKLFIAKLYNHIWYDTDRFSILYKILEDWENNPIKEAKYLEDIHSQIQESDIKF